MSVPDPVTRKEQYLSKAATGSGSIPDPVTREEMYLAEIANGSGGGGGGGALIVNIVIGDENDSLDKTAGEIMSAIQSGKTIMIYDSGLGGTHAYYTLQNAESSINFVTQKPQYLFRWWNVDGAVTASSEDESDYPTVNYD